MLKLAAFADEISPDIDEQIRVCLDNGVRYLELRSVNKINVLDLPPALRQEIKAKLSAAGMAVACIGSPVGKVEIDKPWEEHRERFKIAVELAEFFGAPLIRLFSYYPPGKGQDILRHRDEVVRRFRAKVQYIQGRPLTLVHENEKGIYGEKGRQCQDLMKAIDSPALRTAFDFANFVQAGENPLENWPLLKPYTVHIHIKDAIAAGKPEAGKVVPAGQGDGQLEPILGDAWRSGYRGYLTLEPHLKVAGHSHGETGEELFRVAVQALRDICRRQGIALSE